MDPLALRIGNFLVGNAEGSAGLEITIVGPRLEFQTDVLFAITGANLSPLLNGMEISNWRTYYATAGSVLEFGPCVEGCRSYLAVRGGIDVPIVLGSRSTFLKGQFGGYEGRRLVNRDQIRTFEQRLPPKLRSVRLAYTPHYSLEEPIGITLGPQDYRFTQNAIDTLVTEPFEVGLDSDRMGYRLHGARLEHVDDADIISDYIVCGSIQVPKSGQPIVLMADRQTSGGYTKIATVIKVDIPRLAQAKPGDKVKFIIVNPDDALMRYKRQEQWLKFCKVGLDSVFGI